MDTEGAEDTEVERRFIIKRSHIIFD